MNVKLQKLQGEKLALAAQVAQEEQYILEKLNKKLLELNLEKEKLSKYKISLEVQLEQEQEHIVNKLTAKVDKYSSEKSRLQSEKGDLQRHVTNLEKEVAKLSADKIGLENQLEQEEEKIVNKMQRALEEQIFKVRVLEKRLERRGCGSVSESETR